MTQDQELAQRQDEEQAFFRCVELVQMAQRGMRFTQQDIQDLMAHLGVSNYFKGDTSAENR